MNRIKLIALGILLSTSAISNSFILSIAQEEKDPDYIMDTSKIGHSENGYVRSEQILELGSVTSSALSMEGEQALRMGSLDQALTVLQRSVEMAPLDMDVRILYAQTLEKKLARQKNKKDPKLFNFVVKQWLFVYRKAEFLDQKMLGLNSVIQLTGARPKRWEKDQSFLARVMVPENPSVKLAANEKKAEENMPDNAKISNRKSAITDDAVNENLIRQKPY